MNDMATQHGWIGRCSAKGCRFTARSLSYPQLTRCPEHNARIRFEPVWGEYVPGRPCDARCMNARGPSCDCSCGGANHGCGHIAPVQMIASVEAGETVLVDAPAAEKARTGHETQRLFTPVDVMTGQMGLAL